MFLEHSEHLAKTRGSGIPGQRSPRTMRLSMKTICRSKQFAVGFSGNQHLQLQIDVESLANWSCWERLDLCDVYDEEIPKGAEDVQPTDQTHLPVYQPSPVSNSQNTE